MTCVDGENNLVVSIELIKKVGIDASIMVAAIEKVIHESEQSPHDSICISIKEMKRLTGLSAYKQREAILKLAELNMVYVDLVGVPCERYFMVNHEEIMISYVEG